MYLGRLCCAVLIFFVLPLSQATLVPFVFAECQGGFTYLIESDGGGYYALVGLSSDLRSQYGNHTIRISVNGTYFPSNPAEYLHPDPNFRGVIYVRQYAILSAASTAIFTNPSQISQTTITMATGQVTLIPIMVTGVLDYTNQYCVTPVLATASTGSTEGGMAEPIPGFTTLSILVGLIIGVSFLLLGRTTKTSGRQSRST